MIGIFKSKAYFFCTFLYIVLYIFIEILDAEYRIDNFSIDQVLRFELKA